MRVYIAYATTEGHTGKIVRAIASQIREMGHEVTVFDTSGLMGEERPEAFDRIIVAGSVHEKRHQESLEIFATANRRKIAGKPSLLISVSLAAAFTSGLAEARSYVDTFIDDTGWEPGQVLLVGGAVVHGEYGYCREQFMQHVVLLGRDLLDTSKDHDLTDWDQLARDIEAFMKP